MGILDEDVAAVRDATDLVALVSQYTSLRKVGRRWVGLCPFHAEKTPSFSVNAERGLYYCFGCHAAGDAITFVRETEHLDFAEAVESLARRAGIRVRRTHERSDASQRRKQMLLDAVAKAAEWYHQRLLSAPDAGKARAYLRSRGIDGDLVREFRLGWAPEGWDELARALGLSDAVFQGAGLGFVNSAGRQVDAFRGRIVFPICDVQGRPVGFGARSLPGGGGPKYKNTAETAIYQKGRALYGLDKAKEEIVRSGEVVVCEGYTDVLGFARIGMRRAVATCGTALTEEHVRLLRRFAGRIVLAFDADEAGRAAAERVYEWEQRHGVEFAVAVLPEGKDPADLAREDPDALLDAVARAAPLLGHLVDRVLGEGARVTPEARARLAARAAEVIAEHPDPIVRDQYALNVAARLELEPERVRELAERARKARKKGTRGGVVAADEPSAVGTPAPAAGKPAPDAGKPGPVGGEPDEAVRSAKGSGGGVGARAAADEASSASGPEAEALRIAVTRPEEIVDLLDECLFRSELHAAAFRAIRDTRDIHEAIQSADPGAAELLRRLAVEDSTAEAWDVAKRLADEAGNREISVLENKARHAADEREALEISHRVRSIKLAQQRLRDGDEEADAYVQLLGLLRRTPEQAWSAGGVVSRSGGTV
ncbi:MAG: hypothetical protein KatS3mg008_2163 [Acidimicrobiales bacterium]|nr:MAG: hypothetical protein KatS3mg008_2163 [Acidimicrobiales bacterium]